MSEANYPEVQLQHKFGEWEWLAQTFIPLTTHEMEYVSLKLEPLLYVIYVEIAIQHTLAGVPTGVDLATDRIHWVTLEKYPRNKTIRFRFRPLWRLIAAVEYAIILRLPEVPAGAFVWATYEAPPGHYPRGKMIRSNDGGSSWDTTDLGDLFFAEWGNPPLAPIKHPPPLENFAVLTFNAHPALVPIRFSFWTNVPCHLTCYWTGKTPLKHHTTRVIRGLTVPWQTYFCFVGWQAVEQREYGCTLYHSFDFPSWSYCQTRWFTFRGTVDLVDSPSVGPIFKYHHPGAPPYLTEEQTTGILWSSILDGAGWGQKLTINNRVLSKLSFYLKRVGNPAGYVGYWIRRVSDDSLIWQKILMNSNEISTTPQWYELDIDPPILINEEVRIIAYATNNGAGNLINIYMAITDIKPSEHAFFRNAAGVYTEHPGWDFMYIYTYQVY